MNAISQPGSSINLHQLEHILGNLAPVAVAFSGGVDSGLLLKVAHDLLRNRCLALTVDAPYHIRQELTAASRLADEIGVQHLVIPFNPATEPGLLHNPVDRCYRCKKALFTRCQQTLSSKPPNNGPWTLVDGSTSDDLHCHRPGRRALSELGIRSPLAESGFTKLDIRTLSRQRGLSNWNRAAQSCLMTRFPYDHTITSKELQRVEQAEEGLLALGFRIVRVRSIGNSAQVECGQGELAQALLPEMVQQIKKICTAAGFLEVIINPTAYRSGSMDQN